METRSWKVPADFMSHLFVGPPEEQKEREKENQLGGVRCKFYSPLVTMFEGAYNIDFPVGSSIQFSPNRGLITVRNTKERLVEIDRLIKSLQIKEYFILDDKLFKPLDRLVSNGRAESRKIEKLRWYVSPEVVDYYLKFIEESEKKEGKISSDDPFGTVEQKKEPRVIKLISSNDPVFRDWLEREGVGFSEGASLLYERKNGILTSINTEQSAFTIEHTFLSLAIKWQQEQKRREK